MKPPAGAAPQGIPLGSRLRFSAGPGIVALRATIVAPDGRYSSLDLGSLAPKAATQFNRPLPARLRGGKLVALDLVPPRLVDRGADAGRPLAGQLRIDGLPATSWLGEGGIVVTPHQNSLDLKYRISLQNDARIRARQATDGSPPMVLVTPRLGALAGGVRGTLPLEIGGRPGPGADRGHRRPLSRNRRRCGDRRRRQPRDGRQHSGPGGRRAERGLARRSSRAARSSNGGARPAAVPRCRGGVADSLLAEARDDPLGHGTLLALDSAAAVALLLAALGLALTVLSDLRDDRGDLYDLEVTGRGAVASCAASSA